jgi:hypothetical protein
MLEDPGLADRGIMALCRYVPTCAILELDGSSDITDGALTHIIQAWPNLIELEIAVSSVSDAGLRLLAANTRLERVRFRTSPRISKTGILELLHMPTLSEIQIPMTVFDADEEGEIDELLESRGICDYSK